MIKFIVELNFTLENTAIRAQADRNWNLFNSHEVFGLRLHIPNSKSPLRMSSSLAVRVRTRSIHRGLTVGAHASNTWHLWAVCMCGCTCRNANVRRSIAIASYRREGTHGTCCTGSGRARRRLLLSGTEWQVRLHMADWALVGLAVWLGVPSVPLAGPKLVPESEAPGIGWRQKKISHLE